MAKKGKMTKLSVAIFTALLMLTCAISTLFAACGKVEVILDKTQLTMYTGDSERLTATVNGSDGEVEWTTSDQTVATVRRGMVTAVGAGTATITAAIESGVSATCTVTVSERTVTISQTTANLVIGGEDSVQLSATASDGGVITWTSSDASVASVENGLVKAGDTTGTAEIIATRGTASAKCTVTVTAPEDYYKLTPMENSKVVADPGVWHYFGDGSLGSQFGFEKAPVHMNDTVSGTLNIIPNGTSQFFYYRYQPNQVEIGEYYTLKVGVTVSENADLRFASLRSDGETSADFTQLFTANEMQEIEYIGYRNTSQPFSVRLNSPVEADKLTFTVKLISVEAHDGTNLPNYHTDVVEKPVINYTEIEQNTGKYDLAAKTNTDTMNNKSVWGYNVGSGSELSAAEEDKAVYDNGTITINFATLDVNGKDKSNQLRYRPNLDGNTKIKVEFTVTSNVEANMVLAFANIKDYSSVGWKAKTVSAGQSVDFVTEETLTNDHIIMIQINAAEAALSDARFTISNIKIYKEDKSAQPEQPDPSPEQPDGGESYELNPNGNTDGSKGNVCANAGKWFYMIDNGFDTSTMTASKMENGTLTWSFTKMQATGFYLRYQPDLAVGTDYKISFDLELNRTGSDTIKPRSEGSNHYETKATVAGETLHVEFTDKVVEGNPFAVMLNVTDASEENPLVLKISNVTVVAVS